MITKLLKNLPHIVVCLLLFNSCNSTDYFPQKKSIKKANNKVTKWRKQKIMEVNILTINDNKNFYALGIGKGNSYEVAEGNAKFDADITLAELIESYVKTIHTTYSEEVKKQGSTEIVSEENVGLIFSKSVTFLRNTTYQILNKVEFENTKYVALYVKKNKMDYFNDYMRIAQPSNSDNIQSFFEEAEIKFIEIQKKINEKKENK